MFRVVAETPWYRVDFWERFEEGEMEAWAEGLRQLHRDAAGAHVFRARLGWLQATIAMAKKGELHVSLLLQSGPDYLDEVRMFLNLEQSALPSIADEVAELAR